MVILYSCMEGKYSAREIESACNRDINYIWLLNGEEAPKHYEICRFRSERLPLCAEELFYQLVKKLHVMDEIKYEHLFADGTKIEANANKYSFVWAKTVTKYSVRLQEKLERRASEMCNEYGVMPCEAQELLKTLEERVKVPFVHGRGKRKTQLQRDIEELRQMLSRKSKYEDYQKKFDGRNSFSKTDPDATFMHMNRNRNTAQETKQFFSDMPATQTPMMRRLISGMITGITFSKTSVRREKCGTMSNRVPVLVIAMAAR